MNVTFNQGASSVSLPLIDEGNTPLFISDFGKPNQTIREGMGTIDPRVTDEWSSLRNFNMVGKMFDYDDAIDLADMFKSIFKDVDMTIQPNLPEYEDEIKAFAQAGNGQALSLQYDPGYKDYIQVEASVTQYGEKLGEHPDAFYNTPRKTGNGPVQLKVAGKTIDLGTDLTVTRTIGRPSDVFRGRPGTAYPVFVGKAKSATDRFSIGFQKLSDGVDAMNTITKEVFEVPLGRNGIGLDFNGIFRLGEFTVVPEGSASFRQTRRAGENEVIIVPTLDLRVIQD
jgi:hypothetical protein